MERSKDPLNLNYNFKDLERFGVNTKHSIQITDIHRNPFPIYFNIPCNLKPYTTTMHEQENDFLKLHNSSAPMVNVLTFSYEWEQEGITQPRFSINSLLTFRLEDSIMLDLYCRCPTISGPTSSSNLLKCIQQCF
jgi:hypothetical protein